VDRGQGLLARPAQAAICLPSLGAAEPGRRCTFIRPDSSRCMPSKYRDHGVGAQSRGLGRAGIDPADGLSDPLGVEVAGRVVDRQPAAGRHCLHQARDDGVRAVGVGDQLQDADEQDSHGLGEKSGCVAAPARIASGPAGRRPGRRCVLEHAGQRRRACAGTRLSLSTQTTRHPGRAGFGGGPCG
jgi:hypothetical protein